MPLNKTLRTYGLNEKQAKIYLACLELGTSSVQKISKKTGYPRSTCYDILDSLHKQGLISTFFKKKTRYFTVEDPRVLLNSANEKLKALQSDLPNLLALYATEKEKPLIRFFEGKDQMKNILKEILNEAKELRAIGSPDDIFSSLPKFFPQFVKTRIKKKIPVKTILPDTPLARERQKLGAEQLRIVKLMPTQYIHHSLIYTWQSKIAMFSFKKELVALIIESPEFAKTMKSIFDFMWETADFVKV